MPLLFVYGKTGFLMMWLILLDLLFHMAYYKNKVNIFQTSTISATTDLRQMNRRKTVLAGLRKAAQILLTTKL